METKKDLYNLTKEELIKKSNDELIDIIMFCQKELCESEERYESLSNSYFKLSNKFASFRNAVKSIVVLVEK